MSRYEVDEVKLCYFEVDRVDEGWLKAILRG